MREEKQILLDEIKEKIDQCEGFIIASYQNLNAPAAREFRDKMANESAEFEVVRKRVFLKALESSNIQYELDVLEGHVGVIFAHKDATQVAKSLIAYGKKNEDVVRILGGLIDGEKLSAQELIEVAKLPSIDELRAQIVGLFEAPMRETIGVLQALLCSILYCMEQKQK